MEEVAIANLFTQMIREGLLDEDLVLRASEECEASGYEMAAHQLRCLIVEANVTPPTERRRAERRSRLTAVTND